MMLSRFLLFSTFLWATSTLSLAWAEVIDPPAELYLDGIPILSTEIIEETKKYTEFRPTLFADWHPRENKFLALRRPESGNSQQLFEIGNTIDSEILLIDFSDRILDATYEPRAGRYVVFSSDHGGSEKAQNYRYDLSDGKVTLLTDGKSKNSLGIWSRSGTWMAFRSNERNGKDSDFYIIDPERPESKRRFAEMDNGDSWTIQDWSWDDTKILALNYKSINESSVWEIDRATGEKRQITLDDSGEKVSYSSPKFAPNGREIFVITDKGSEFARLVRIDRDTHEMTILSGDIPWDVESFEMSHSGREIALITNEEGVSRLSILELDSQMNVAAARTPSPAPMGVFSSLKWHSRLKLIGMTVSSSSSPSEVYQVHPESLRFRHRTRNNLEREVSFIQPRLVKWPSFDGRKIPGFLYEPSTEAFPGKRPVMVVIHGGPESQARPTFLARNNFYLEKMGVALLYPNIRGSSGYGKTYVKLPNGLNRESAYEDLNAMLDWIKEQPNLDGNRIFVTGGSYGGHAALAVATRYNDKIRCSLDSVGMSNLVTFLEHTEPYRQDLRREIYGDERVPEIREFLERIAPLNHSENIKKPLFIVQGQNDPRVPYTEAEQMLDTVKKNQTPVWYLKAANEGHGFSNKVNQDFQFYAMIEFMRRYLLNE